MSTAYTTEELTTEEVARLCGVTAVTIVRWVKSGRLQPLASYNPYRRRQPAYRFHREDVERLAEPVAS